MVKMEARSKIPNPLLERKVRLPRRTGKPENIKISATIDRLVKQVITLKELAKTIEDPDELRRAIHESAMEINGLSRGLTQATLAWNPRLPLD